MDQKRSQMPINTILKTESNCVLTGAVLTPNATNSHSWAGTEWSRKISPEALASAILTGYSGRLYQVSSK